MKTGKTSSRKRRGKRLAAVICAAALCAAALTACGGGDREENVCGLTEDPAAAVHELSYPEAAGTSEENDEGSYDIRDGPERDAPGPGPEEADPEEALKTASDREAFPSGEEGTDRTLEEETGEESAARIRSEETDEESAARTLPEETGEESAARTRSEETCEERSSPVRSEETSGEARPQTLPEEPSEEAAISGEESTERRAAETPSASAAPAPAAHRHSYTGNVTKAATCGAAGIRTFTCSCGNSFAEEIPATGDHRWTECTEIVHHEAQTHVVHHDELYHTEWIVDQEAWDEYITEIHSFCNGCGEDLTLLLREEQILDYSDHALQHDQSGEPAYGYHMEEVILETIRHEETGHEETVIDAPAWDETLIDVPAWDETVIIGRKCTICGKYTEN